MERDGITQIAGGIQFAGLGGDLQNLKEVAETTTIEPARRGRQAERVSTRTPRRNLLIRIGHRTVRLVEDDQVDVFWQRTEADRLHTTNLNTSVEVHVLGVQLLVLRTLDAAAHAKFHESRTRLINQLSPMGQPEHTTPTLCSRNKQRRDDGFSRTSRSNQENATIFRE